MTHTSHSARTGPFRHSASTSRSAMIITGSIKEEPMPMYLEPSYRLDPAVTFPEQTTRDVIKEVLENAFNGMKYDSSTCNGMCRDLASQIKTRVKSLSTDRYKVVTFVMVGQEELGTINFASRCLWNAKHDTYAEYTYRNGSLYAVGMVYGVYAE